MKPWCTTATLPTTIRSANTCKQRNFFPLFLTDTEVSVLLLDLLNRVYDYPLEYIIEALAPTTELDFDQLPADKQKIYRAIQAAHIHGSPTAPGFSSLPATTRTTRQFQLIGITDTAMLRPQVFALQDGEVQIGLVCSEKQAIDATLHSLAKEDPRFCPVADKYWNARGGSHTDGGAFIFTVKPRKTAPVRSRFTCTDKFGNVHADGKENLRSTGPSRCRQKPGNHPHAGRTLDGQGRTRYVLVFRQHPGLGL